MSETENTSRSYGAGAAGEITSTQNKSTQATFRQKFRYRFDNSLSKGPGAFASWLAITSMVLTALVAIVWQVTEPVADVNILQGVITRFFDSINVIFLGAGIPFATPLERILAIAFWLIRTAIAGSVIGFITNVIADRMQRLKKVRAQLLNQATHLFLAGHLVSFRFCNKSRSQMKMCQTH